MLALRSPRTPRPSTVRLGLVLLCSLAPTWIGCGDGAAPGDSVAIVSRDNVEDLALAATDVAARAAISGELGDGLFDPGTSLEPVAAGVTLWSISDVVPQLESYRVTPTSITEGAAASPMRPVPYVRETERQRTTSGIHALRPWIEDYDDPYPDPLGLCSAGGARFDGESLRFMRCDAAELCTLDGHARVEVAEDGDAVTVHAVDLSADCPGYGLFELDGDRLVCSGLSSGPVRCSYEIGDFTGAITGVRFGLSALQLTGSHAAGFSIEATVVDPDHGRMTLTTLDPIGFGACPDDVPEAGRVRFDGAGPSLGHVAFLGCSEYAVCFQADEAAEPECVAHAWASLFDAS